MKSRLITLTSVLALVVALLATTSASAQTSPGQDVYNPNSGVLGVVQGGGEPPSGGSGTAPSGASGTAPSGAAKNATASKPVARETGATAPSTTAPAAPVVTKGQLPFTGFQAGLVALLGLLLLGTGAAMRRVARSDS